MKKKANIQTIIGVILFFSIVIFIFLFGTIGIKQILSENLISPVKDVVTPLVSSGTSTQITGYVGQFNADWFNYDVFFLIFVLSAFIGTIVSSFKEKKLGWLSFFGFVTIGSYIFLLMITFITNLFDWLMTNFFFNLFNLTLVNTPIIDFFVSNISIISFVWFLVILMVNQIDLEGFVKKDSDELVLK